MSPVNATLQTRMCMFTKITYNIQVENRIRIFVRKVRVDKTLWPEKPKETQRERERERTHARFGRGWKIHLKSNVGWMNLHQFTFSCGVFTNSQINVLQSA